MAERRTATAAPWAALAALVLPFAGAAAVWASRTAPYEHVDCANAGPPAVRAAWLAGLEPVAFALACVCVAVAVWAGTAIDRRRGPLIGGALTLLAGAWWWATGAGSPAAWAGLVAGLLGIVLAPVAVGWIVLIVWRLAHGDHGRAWRSIHRVAVIGAVALVPLFVVEVGSWGFDVYC
jgi:hypothetical protein